MKKGWQIESLADISSITYGFTESASVEAIGPKFLRITDIQNDHVDWPSVPYCKIESSEISKYRLEAGDIVFARTGATTGKHFLIKSPPVSVFASYLIRLRLLSKELMPEFVSYFFQTQHYWQAVKNGISGSAQGGFNATKLGALKIAFPCISEQQRIVAILDEAFAGIATAKANTEKNLQNSHAIFESHLNELFLRVRESHPAILLKDVCQRVTKGSSPKWQGISYVDQPGVLFVTSENVHENRLVIDQPKYVEEEFNQKEKRSILKFGDVLTNLVGASIGRTAVFDRTDVANINQAVSVISCFPEKVFNYYLMYYFNSRAMKDFFHSNEVNNARANISLTFLSELGIPLPSVEMQKSIVGHIQKYHKFCECLESIYKQKLAALDELKRSLLHRAFSGEL